jgi:hypothetical protein
MPPEIVVHYKAKDIELRSALLLININFTALILLLITLCLFPLYNTLHLVIESRPAVGPTQPPIQWALPALFPGVKWLGGEAEHLPP